MKPLQRSEVARNRQIQRDEATRRTAPSRSITEYDKWVEGIKSNDGQFGSPAGYRSPGAWSSRILPNSKSMPSNRDETEEPDTDRGAGSPILWKKSPADESSHHMLRDQNDFPATRTQEIAGYRKEMMEMVRGLPEADFELTLQDIVEKRKDFKEEIPVRGKELVNNEKHTHFRKSNDKETKRKKNQKKFASVARSNSIDTGLLTRMFLPLSVVVRRKSLNLRERGEKVATKQIEEKKKVIERKKSKDEEWWGNNEFSEKGSNSSSIGSSTSTDSGSSNDDHFSRNMSLKQPKCACFRPGKSKAKSS